MTELLHYPLWPPTNLSSTRPSPCIALSPLMFPCKPCILLVKTVHTEKLVLELICFYGSCSAGSRILPIKDFLTILEIQWGEQGEQAEMVQTTSLSIGGTACKILGPYQNMLNLKSYSLLFCRSKVCLKKF